MGGEIWGFSANLCSDSWLMAVGERKNCLSMCQNQRDTFITKGWRADKLPAGETDI